MNKIDFTFVVNLLIIAIVGLLLSNCASSKNGLLDRIKVEEDIVHSIKRIRFEHTYRYYFSKTPLITLNQTYVKSIKENGKFTINVYDKLTLKAGDFRLEDSVFMIANRKVYAIAPQLFEYERIKKSSTSKKKVTTKDNDEIDVVTGYREDDRDIVRINYQLTDKMINAVKTADTVFYRYYAGPNMITINVQGEVLDAVKGVINKN